jgi:hypothetical protein
MPDKDEQTMTGSVAMFAGSAFKKRKKKKKKRRKTPLALAYSGLGIPTGFESTTDGGMSQFGGHPPYSDQNVPPGKGVPAGRPGRLIAALAEAVDAWVERALQPGPGRKKRSGKEMKRFLKKRGLLNIPRQRMK